MGFRTVVVDTAPEPDAAAASALAEDGITVTTVVAYTMDCEPASVGEAPFDDAASSACGDNASDGVAAVAS